MNDAHDIQLSILFQAMSEGVILYESDGRVSKFNPAALKILGATESQLLGSTVHNAALKFINEDRSPLNPTDIPSQICRKTGKECRNVIGVYQPEGNFSWISVTAVPVIGGQVLTTFVDVTELKDVQEKLVSREKFLNNLLNAIPLQIGHVNTESVYTYVNNAYEIWFKKKRKDIIGKHLSHVISEEGAKFVEPYVKRVLAGEQVCFERRHLHNGEGEKIITVHYIPSFSGEKVDGFFVIVIDQTEIVQIKEKIQLQEEELTRILDILPAVIGHWSKDLLNIHANAGYERTFGISPARLKGMHIKDMMGPKVFESNLPHIKQVLEGVPQDYEMKFPGADGVERVRKVQLLPEIIKNEVAGFYVIAIDVTELKRATQLRDETLALVTHDLKSPLTITLLVVELFKKKEKLSQQGLEKLGIVEKNTKNMVQMINDLLDIHKLEQGKSTMDENRTLISPHELFNQVIESQKHVANSKNITMEIDIPDNLPEVFVNTMSMERVLQNLISNSLKFTPNNGVIKVMTKHIGHELQVAVQDTGPGIEPKLLPHIFDRFSQAQSKSHLGTGLGLTIAKGIVEAHEGKIWVESQVGKGCTITFTIPYPLSYLRS